MRASWTALGFVGDLVKLVLERSGVCNIPGAQGKLEHELADCLWSVIILAERYKVDLETAFLKTMDDLEAHLAAASVGLSKEV